MAAQAARDNIKMQAALGTLSFSYPTSSHGDRIKRLRFLQTSSHSALLQLQQWCWSTQLQKHGLWWTLHRGSWSQNRPLHELPPDAQGLCRYEVESIRTILAIWPTCYIKGWKAAQKDCALQYHGLHIRNVLGLEHQRCFWNRLQGAILDARMSAECCQMLWST